MKEAQQRNGKRSRRARADRKGSGLASVLLGTLLLAVLGFGLGIAAGLVLEEPKLLLDYLTGRTTSAPLEQARDVRNPVSPEPTPIADAAAPPAPTEPTRAQSAPAREATPPVAAPPPAERRVVEVAVPKEPAAQEAVEAPLPEAVPRSGGYSVQVGALADSAGAEQLAAKLRKRGFSVYVAPSAEATSNRWRVRVGPVATREEARALAARLESEKFPTWVLAEGQR